jgi:hypothetical protein
MQEIDATSICWMGISEDSFFYLRPLTNVQKKHDSVCFSNVPVDRNKLATIAQEM